MENLAFFKWLQTEWAKVSPEDFINFAPPESQEADNEVIKEMTLEEKTLWIIIEKNQAEQRKLNHILEEKTPATQINEGNIKILKGMLFQSIKMEIMEMENQKLPYFMKMNHNWAIVHK